MNIVLATTTRYTFSSEVDKIRMELALETFRRARKMRYEIVAIDDNSVSLFRNEASRIGVILISQQKKGPGNARREAIKHASYLLKSHTDLIVWLEPEKCNLIPYISYIQEVAKKRKGSEHLYLFYRKTLESYPIEQQLVYIYGRILAKYILGEDIDLFFGPIGFTRVLSEYFIEYEGRYGDTWDSIHIPKLRILASGIPYTQLYINYTHPHKQTAVEKGNPDLLLKRARQIYNLTWAYITEARRLNLIS